jgi:hypothetical protein
LAGFYALDRVRNKDREAMNKITGDTSVAEIVKLCPNARAASLTVTD